MIRQVILLQITSFGVRLISVDNVSGKLPIITRGLPAAWEIALYDADSKPLTNEELSSRSWELILSSDWNPDTRPQLRGIVRAESDRLICSFPETNTVELITALGQLSSLTIGAELIGIPSGTTIPDYVLNFNAQMKNRRSDANSSPITESGEGTYSIAQINALLMAGQQIQYSELNDDIYGHSEQSPEDRYWRYRNPQIANSEWSLWIGLVAGPVGPAATFEVVRTETLPPDSSVEIIDAPESTPGNRKYIVKIPQGNQGIQGERGIQGNQGIQGERGPKIESFPPFSPVIAGWEYWLDATFNRLDLLYRVRGMKKIRLALASANPAITGNIAVAFMINDIESAVVAIPVGATETEFEHVFTTPVSGKFAIVRRIENPLDTLRDGVPVTAVLTNIELEY